MLVLAYVLIIAFEILGGFVVRKKGGSAVRPLAAAFLIGGGIAFCVCPLVFHRFFIYFDQAAENSMATPLLIALSTLALLWFGISAAVKRN